MAIRQALLTTLILLAASCAGQSTEERAREAAEKIQESMPNVDAIAAAQEVDPEVVKQVQRQLTTLNEYQGEITGELDPVTINAIQAFQRSVTAKKPWWRPWARLKDNGIINSRTRDELAAAVGEKK